LLPDTWQPHVLPYLPSNAGGSVFAVQPEAGMLGVWTGFAVFCAWAAAALVLGAQLGGVLGALFAIPIAGIINVYLGALYRARSGGDAFQLPQRVGSGASARAGPLPNLGEEISQAAVDDARETRAAAAAGPDDEEPRDGRATPAGGEEGGRSAIG